MVIFACDCSQIFRAVAWPQESMADNFSISTAIGCSDALFNVLFIMCVPSFPICSCRFDIYCSSYMAAYAIIRQVILNAVAGVSGYDALEALCYAFYRYAAGNKSTAAKKHLYLCLVMEPVLPYWISNLFTHD